MKLLPVRDQRENLLGFVDVPDDSVDRGWVRLPLTTPTPSGPISYGDCAGPMSVIDLRVGGFVPHRGANPVPTIITDASLQTLQRIRSFRAAGC